MGDIFATGGEDKRVNLWSIKKSKIIDLATLKCKYPVCAISFSLDNEYFVSCTTDHRAIIYNLKGQIRPKSSFVAHQDIISSARFLFSQR